MNTHIHTSNLSDQKKYSSFKKNIEKERSIALKKRLRDQAFMTDMEYISGAFIEMYEPYLKDIVHRLFEKGYAIDVSSGFGNSKYQYQSLNGHFTVDYITRNKLEKEGIKVRDENGLKMLVFWAEKLDLEYIKQKWLKIIEILPDKGKLTTLLTSPKAVLFRRKYMSKNPDLQRKRLFERLSYSVQTTVKNDIKNRKLKNPHPNKLESQLGIFIEELEPQVRHAVIVMNKKGYSTDLSGFVSNSCEQMIEGDFQLDEKIISKLNNLNIKVETNPSGYTRLVFAPKAADIKKIKKQWDQIVSLLPNRKKTAFSSMTRKAREFRGKYN